MRALLCLLLSPLLLAAPDLRAQDDTGFRFVRVRFEDLRSRRWGGDAWAHDYPTAEHNLYEALKRTTSIRVEPPPIVLDLDDPRIFDYPILYLCEPGYWSMTEAEVGRLRAYLERGGFILFDDFRGLREWLQLEHEMARVFPDRQPVEIPPDHPIWDIYYTIDPVEAPSNVSGGFGRYEDRYLAYFDDHGRMMALACFNQDIGDGWEWPERNVGNASTVSFQMGLNFIIYALTH